ncbi:MAG TPA: hypothetical protein VK249_30360 [Anaerolineales bacterium]|nr:hypothetical protein [Anaerolineales bacterium]
MSGIGHLAAGFMAKPLTPEVPLWVLLAAGETNDLLYFLFSSTGIEPKASLTIDFAQGARYVNPVTNPWSHGLFMSIVWSLAAALGAFLFYRNRRTAAVIGLVVLSHWLLDFLMHSNLPLFFAGSPLLGLGLENSGAGLVFMTILDLILLGGGIAIYLRSRRRRITRLNA